MKYVTPSVRETAFNCPHCGVLTTQYWYSVHVDQMGTNSLPRIIHAHQLETMNFDRIQDEKKREEYKRLVEKKVEGRPFMKNNPQYRQDDLHNVYMSHCFNCGEVALWIFDKLIYPQRGEAPPANPDLPPDIRSDYNEASAILDLSPRGAAALIRLGIQKLTKHLGQGGENINADIKALVAGGLDRRVQRSLDAVRVIGNNAVHPGQIDLQDDRPVAESLFGLLNLIAEKMISEPKHVDEVYEKLPSSARAAIEERDGKAE